MKPLTRCLPFGLSFYHPKKGQPVKERQTLFVVVVGCCWLLLVVAGCCWLLLVVVGCRLLLSGMDLGKQTSGLRTGPAAAHRPGSGHHRARRPGADVLRADPEACDAFQLRFLGCRLNVWVWYMGCWGGNPPDFRALSLAGLGFCPIRIFVSGRMWGLAGDAPVSRQSLGTAILLRVLTL